MFTIREPPRLTFSRPIRAQSRPSQPRSGHLFTDRHHSAIGPICCETVINGSAVAKKPPIAGEATGDVSKSPNRLAAQVSHLTARPGENREPAVAACHNGRQRPARYESAPYRRRKGTATARAAAVQMCALQEWLAKASQPWRATAPPGERIRQKCVVPSCQGAPTAFLVSPSRDGILPSRKDSFPGRHVGLRSLRPRPEWAARSPVWGRSEPEDPGWWIALGQRKTSEREGTGGVGGERYHCLHTTQPRNRG